MPQPHVYDHSSTIGVVTLCLCLWYGCSCALYPCHSYFIFLSILHLWSFFCASISHSLYGSLSLCIQTAALAAASLCYCIVRHHFEPGHQVHQSVGVVCLCYRRWWPLSLSRTITCAQTDNSHWLMGLMSRLLWAWLWHLCIKEGCSQQPGQLLLYFCIWHIKLLLLWIHTNHCLAGCRCTGCTNTSPGWLSNCGGGTRTPGRNDLY